MYTTIDKHCLRTLSLPSVSIACLTGRGGQRDDGDVVRLWLLGGGGRRSGAGRRGLTRAGGGRGPGPLTQQRHTAPGACHVTTGQLHLDGLTVREPGE